MGNARLVFHIPHDMPNLFRIGLLSDGDVYDASGKVRGTISRAGITLTATGKTYSLYEAAVENHSQLGFTDKVRSGWKYWYVLDKNGVLMSIYEIRKALQDVVDGQIKQSLRAANII